MLLKLKSFFFNMATKNLHIYMAVFLLDSVHLCYSLPTFTWRITLCLKNPVMSEWMRGTESVLGP